MDTLTIFRLSPLCCYLGAWFLSLPLLLSFSAYQLNKSTISLAHLSNPSLFRHWQSPRRTQAVRLTCTRKTISLLYSSEYFGMGSLLQLPGSGITNSSCPLLLLCHQAPNTPGQNSGFSACGASTRLWVCLCFVHEDTLPSNGFFLSSECLLLSLIYIQADSSWGECSFLYNETLCYGKQSLHALIDLCIIWLQRQRQPQISSLEETRALSMHTGIQSTQCHSLSLLHPFPPLCPEKLHTLIFS